SSTAKQDPRFGAAQRRLTFASALQHLDKHPHDNCMVVNRLEADKVRMLLEDEEAHAQAKANFAWEQFPRLHMWWTRGTIQTGLHYDAFDTTLLQIRGNKRA